jgi:hypothetical protein
MRVARLVAAGLLGGAAAGFLIALLRPRRPDDTVPDYVGQVRAQASGPGPTDSPDAQLETSAAGGS